jgi:hypothetical protein
MTSKEISDLEEKILHLIGINTKLQARINSIENNLFKVISENLLAIINKYLQLPDSNRKFSIKKFNTDPNDQYTYTLEFIKLR